MGKVLAYAIGPCVLVILLGYLLYLFCRPNRSKTRNNVPVPTPVARVARELVINRSPEIFPYDVLDKATNHFSENLKIGEGKFGQVYRGVLQQERVVAVKKLKIAEKDKKEFIQEVNNGVALSHRNLVRLIGYNNDRKNEHLIVFEFVPNGTLHDHLYDEESGPLSWENRYKIALGLGEGIKYLHSGGNRCCIHRDIKPRNVMLDGDFTPKLGDFGLARFTEHDASMRTTAEGGTFGYFAPEVASGNAKSGKESDVYSFGIVALEIVTGRVPIGQTGVVGFVRDLESKSCVLRAVDKRLGTRFNKDEARRLLVVGLLCCNAAFDKRPEMEQVIQWLKLKDDGRERLSSEKMERLVKGYFKARVKRSFISIPPGVSRGALLNQASSSNNTSNSKSSGDNQYYTRGVSHGPLSIQASSSNNTNNSNISGDTRYYTPAQSESGMNSYRVLPPLRNPRKSTPGVSHGPLSNQASSSNNTNSSNISGDTRYYTPAQSESGMDDSRVLPPLRNQRKLTPGATKGLSNIKE